MNDDAPPPVLVIGESLIDVVRSGDNESRRPGGSPMNVAYGLSRLGVGTRLLTRIGNDADGEAIVRHLSAAGVTLVDESPHAARTSVSIATIESGGSANYSFDIDWALEPFSEPSTSQWIHVGSLATFLAPGADSLERILRSAGPGTLISYDPNIRPALVGDYHRALSRFERIAGLAGVVKLSEEDAAWLYPASSEDAIVDRILSLGPEIVAVTRGAAGARISTRHDAVAIEAQEVVVADTIGAGDSFMAALISVLLPLNVKSLTSKELGHVARLSVMAAALTCARTGAQPPSLLELAEALRKQSHPGKRTS